MYASCGSWWWGWGMWTRSKVKGSETWPSLSAGFGVRGVLAEG